MLGKVSNEREYDLSLVGSAGRREDTDWFVFETPEGEREDGGRRRVNRVRVVDGDQDGTIGGQRPQDAEHRQRDRPLVDGDAAGFGAKQGDGDGAALRLGKGVEHSI